MTPESPDDMLKRLKMCWADLANYPADQAALAEAVRRWTEYDRPEFDGTDAAHPAYWRGQESGVNGAVARIREALAGEVSGACQEPLQSLRVAVDRMRAALKIIADHDPDTCSGITPRDCLDSVREIARAALAEKGGPNDNKS